MRTRVVVTGMGTVTPHSDDVDVLFEKLCRGESAVDRITLFDPVDHPTQVAAEVRYPLPGPDRVGPYPAADRTTRFAVRAASLAITSSRLPRLAEDDHRARRRRLVHLTVGVGSTAMEALGPATLAAWGGPETTARPLPALRAAAGRDHEGARALSEWFCDDTAPALGVLFDAGRVATAASACASGSHAVWDAVMMLRRGDVDVALCGGVCTPITRAMMPGFSILSALTTNNADPKGASRPFDRGRDGFVMAEGCSLLVLETLDHALARDARILGEVLGVGIASDSYRLTDPEPEGRGMAAAMRGALDDAGLRADDVDYINAHGTSTKLNDAAETRAIKVVLGERAHRVPVSSCKSMFGHLIHAAGTTEAIACFQAIRRGIIPPTINLHDPDPDCDLDYVPHVAREQRVRIALNNSFGFGGQNVSLALSAWDGRRA
jgi:3-oxoacyl-[acyl-carrier-protein] synthase II